MVDYAKEQPTQELDERASKGAIAAFARHRTAPNILMVLMIIFGVWASFQILSQFFPDIVRDRITVTESWAGAAAEDVDTGLIQVIEPTIRFLEGVDEVSTSAQEGRATISIEFFSGTDMSEAASEVDTAVNSTLSSLPEDANDPRIRRAPFRDVVSRVVVSGPFERPALLEFAEEIREGLLSRGLLQVDIAGSYRPEIRIEPDPAALRRIDMTIQQVANRLAAQSQDTPVGDIGGGNRLVRFLGQRLTAVDYQNLPIKSLPDGTQILLSDIASVREIDASNGVQAFRNSDPAIELTIMRGSGGDSLKQQEIVDEYLEEVKAELPQSLQIGVYNIRADIIRARLMLLVENGIYGLVIVLLLLFLFLNWRTAFWVAAGIPISLAATIGVMFLMGQSINMISMFALILSLGIIVDDAIVVGEHADHLHRAGFKPATASVLGAQRMAGPVFSSAVTTILAFGVMLALGGRFGQILAAIPLAIVAVLIASLVECFFVLPGHMRHSFVGQERGRGIGYLLDLFFRPIRSTVDAGFDFFRYRIFRPIVRWAIVFRYPVLAFCAFALIYAISMVATRQIPFQFFSPPELNIINANVEMVSGSKRSDTIEQLEEMQRALEETIKEFSEEGQPSPVLMSVYKVGGRVGRRFGAGGSQDLDLIGGFSVELAEEEDRKPHFKTFEFTNAWNKRIQKGPKTAKLSARGFRAGPGGDDIDVRLIGKDATSLKAAAGELMQYLQNVPGVSGAEDDMPFGKPEFRLRVTEKGEALGLDASFLGRELRAALEGIVVERFARDNREVSVRIKLADDLLDAAFLFTTEIQTPSGTYVPLAEVVDIEETQGFAIIRRFDGQRQISVSADLNADDNTIEGVQQELEAGILPELQGKYNLNFEFEGRARQQQEFMTDAMVGFGLALLGIYLILSWVFSSFTRPLVVMLIIPMGFVGMVLGHWVEGIAMSLFSVIGFIGLTGIIVNDSIVLVTTVDRRSEKQPVRSAIVDGVTDRLRAVFLTSATTIGGLLPLLNETSVQAKFLQPTVITMIYGLGLGTILVLFVVPALVAMQYDFHRIFTSFRRACRYVWA